MKSGFVGMYRIDSECRDLSERWCRYGCRIHPQRRFQRLRPDGEKEIDREPAFNAERAATETPKHGASGERIEET